MFQAPQRSATTYVAPPSNLSLDDRYLFKVIKIEDQGVSKYADPTKGENHHDIRWEFNVAQADSKTPIFDPEGNPWVFVDYTTSKIGKNPKSGMVAKARLWIEAFLGRSVEDEEAAACGPAQLVGKYAVGFFEEKERESQDGTPYTKLAIMRLSPFRPGQKSEPKPEPPPPPPSNPDLPF